MGKKNPIKEVMTAASNLTFAPASRIARQLGAEGLADGIDKFKNAEIGLGHGTVDLINNEKGKQQKKEDAAKAEAEKQANAVNAENAKKQAAADYAASEEARMNTGSASRTLLTGPAGLQDDEDLSISRRTLRAR